MFVFLGLRGVALAEGSDTSSGAGDVTTTVPLVAPDGETTVIEHTTSGSSANDLDGIDPDEEERTFTNDIPSVTTTTVETLDEGGAVTDTTVTNTLSDTGESVELDDPTVVTADNTIVTEADGTRTTVTVSDSENAIQKAIDKVLAAITIDSLSATVNVSAGTYNGNITISANSNVAENFILYILAEDSYEAPVAGELIDQTTIGTQSVGAAFVNGDVCIDGINVVMAGLYLSLEKIVSAKNSQLSIYGTEKDDTISVKLEGDSSAMIYGGPGNDTLSVSGAGGATDDASRGTLTLSGGAGDDRIIVDASLAGNASQATLSGGDGIDQLHLSGTLKQGGSSTAGLDAFGNPTIALQTESDSVLQFALSGIEHYTDALKNKARVTITSADIADYSFTASQPFVDYVLAASDLPSGTDTLIISGNGFLASLIIEGDSYTVYDLDASGLNITLNGKQITIDGTLRGANLILNAADDDVTLSVSVDDLGVDPDSIEQLGIDGETSADISIFDIVSTALISITQSAHLIASGSVSLSASTSQTHPLIPLVGAGCNMVNVKVGSATVTILGQITSGGNVDVSAKTTITAEASNATLAQFFVPLAVGVMVANAEVTLGENAAITAAGSVSMLSQTDVTLKVRSTAGKLPISLAVSVVVTDSHVNVLGDIVSQAGSISANAIGNATVTTTASNKAPAATATTSSAGTNSTGGTGGTTASGNSFGGFFAISVVLQNVDASVRAAASLSAYKNISIDSSAKERVATTATSADPVKEGASSGSSQSTSGVLGIVKSLFSTVTTALTGKAKDAFTKGTDSVNSVDGYAITAEPCQHGAIVTPAKVKAGETATVKVTPDEGYVLEGLTYTYLPAGQSAYVTRSVNILGSTNSYTFEMPTAAVTITAVLREQTAQDPDPSTGNLFDEDGDDGTGVEDVINNGAAGSEENDQVQTPEDTGDAYAITISPGLVNGALVIDAQRADAGVQIVITINPSANYQLKADTLKATTQLEGRTSIQTISKSAAGQYLLTMPAGDVTLSAEFEAVPAGTTPTTGSGKPSSSSIQATGALAISVSQNKNNAYIDTTGTVTAGGALSIHATALTQNTLTADGSPVGTAVGAALDPTSPEAAPQDEPDEVTQEQTKQTSDGRPIVIDMTINGTVSFVSFNTTDGKAAFQLAVRQGYKLTDGTLKFRYTDPISGTETQGDLIAGSGDNYYFVIPSALQVDTPIHINATFEAERYNITYSSADVSGAANAKKGDTVSLTVAAQAGKTASVLITGAAVSESGGAYSFVMPGQDVTVSVTYADKASVLELIDDALTYLTPSDTHVNEGETITFTLKPEAVSSGKQFTIAVKLYYFDIVADEYVEDTDVTIQVTDNSFVAPADLGPNIKLVVTATATNKAHAITVNTPTNGTISAPAYANGGETITITVTPAAGFKLKPDSLKIKTVEASVDATITVTADANGVYTHKLPVPVGGESAPMNIVIWGEFVKDPNYTGETTSTAKKKSFSLGVGIAVAVVTHQNYAYIKNGTISANSLSLSATSGSDTEKLIFSAESKAGYSQGDFGIAGAITVQVVSAKTKALIGQDAVITLGEGGTLRVISESYESSKTIAKSVSTGTAARLGVGAGIAVGVFGIDVISCVADNAAISVLNNAALKNVTVSAAHDNTEALSAEAGSSGGISITPVLALLISGAHVEATLGTSAQLLNATEDVSISAKSNCAREMAANASAAGGSVGVGASFSISVLNDSATAALRRSMHARTVKIIAVSRSSLKSTSRAGSQGASSKSSSSSTSTESTSSEGEEGEADQQADKGISGGANLAGKTGSSNVNSSAIGNLSTNRQTAQTSEGNVQVAAGFNLNIMANRAEAVISGGATVTAYTPTGTPEDVPAGLISVEAYSDTDAAIYANASATKAKIGVGVAVAINIVSYDTLAHIDDAAISADTLRVLARMYEAAKSTTTQAEGSTSKNIIETLVEQAITEMLHDMADAMGMGDLLEASTLDDALVELIGDIVGTAVNTLLSGTGLEGLVSNDIETKIQSKLATLGVELTDAVKTQVSAAILEIVLAKIKEIVTPGSSTPPTLSFGDVVNRVATNIANEVFDGVVDITKLKEFFKNGVATQLKTKLTQILKDAGKALTTTALDALSGWLDLPIERIDLGPGHEFTTQAVAGAGASNVGIAGSAAVAIITGNTSAYLLGVTNRTQYPVIVSGETEIDAYARQKISTVASSAVGSDGMADKNLTAGGSGDTGDGSSAGSQYGTSTQGQFIIGSMQNGKVTVSGNSLTVTPDEGYRISGALKAVRSDTGKEITLTDNGDGNYTYTAPTGSDALAADASITISALFEEDLKTVALTTSTNGTLSVSDLTKAAAASARMGERLLVTAKAAEGYILDKLEYTYTVEGSATPTTKQIVSVEDKASGVYTFYMPDAAITVSAVFRALAAGETPPTQTSNTTSSGKSVGVGASFSLNIATFDVVAEIGANRSVRAGTLSVSANGRHDIQTVAVSGSDPLSGTDNTTSSTTTDTGKAKDIALDASAAVGLVYNTIVA
ncbi:MAG: hypothetical protein Q8S22_02065, partial [Eubacteriales bacterium]|nr:hypothetical protein [Eubacteriales bacterium]